MMSYTRGVEIVSGPIIENDKGEILMTKSPKWSNKWILPGGHVEPGETLEQSLIRETQEETGLTIKFMRIFHFGELINSKDFHRPAHFIYFDAHCKLEGGELKLDGGELTAYKWILPNEALSLDLAESYRETIEKFIQYKNG